jgi:hypothetical protein
MTAAIKLREVAYPSLFAAPARIGGNIFAKNEELTNEESTLPGPHSFRCALREDTLTADRS